MERERENKAKFLFFGSTTLLILLGLALMANSSIPLSQANFGESYYYLRHQILFGIGAGLLLLFTIRKIKLELFKKYALVGIVIVIAALSIVFIPHLSYGAGGAKRWLIIFGISFQPSELAKLALVIYLAHWLESKKEKINKPTLIIPVLFWLGILGGLILLEPDYGTFLIMASISFGMYYSAGANKKTVLITVLIGLLALGALIAVKPYRRERVLSFLHPTKDVSGKSYQQNQALIAIGSGGFFGRGLGKGIQKYSYLPETIGDSVFAIIAEELGWLGASGVMVLFLIWILSGLKIASLSPSIFGRNLAAGIVIWIGGQAFINILGIIGLIPFTGIPVPFISYGGSALIIELAAVGLVANVAKN